MRRAAVGGLMIVSALTFLAASLIHFGMRLVVFGATIEDPFSGAAIPEMIIAIVMALGSLSVLGRHRLGRQVALTAVSLALLGVLYGLSVTLRGGRTGDVAYHFAVLALLLVISFLLLRPRTSLALRSGT